MTILIKNGHVLDPGTGLDDICDVLIDGDRITEVEKNIETESDRVIDADAVSYTHLDVYKRQQQR